LMLPIRRRDRAAPNWIRGGRRLSPAAPDLACHLKLDGGREFEVLNAIEDEVEQARGGVFVKHQGTRLFDNSKEPVIGEQHLNCRRGRNGFSQTH
jgi:hypothetical protein